LDALIYSTLGVAIAEIGDKTQLLSLFLVSRFHQRAPIILGILVATLLNHALSAWLGAWLANLIPAGWQNWLVGGSFILVALWLLIPDKEEDEDSGILRYSAFTATTVLFFLAEIGDKTQIATVLLAARFEETAMVILGTTLGMLAANVPVILAGRWLMDRLPLNAARIGAFVLFLILGIVTATGAWNRL
jgi:putative Ca2+/H+ antiporter (TMEM165/GDT1 family)